MLYIYPIFANFVTRGKTGYMVNFVSAAAIPPDRKGKRDSNKFLSCNLCMKIVKLHA